MNTSCDVCGKDTGSPFADWCDDHALTPTRAAELMRRTDPKRIARLEAVVEAAREAKQILDQGGGRCRIKAARVLSKALAALDAEQPSEGGR
jgi:hypothetical protein